MKILPNSKASIIRTIVIFAVLLALCYFRNLFSLFQLAAYEPREGDILFQSLPRGDLVDAIEGVTQSPWSHCGVLMQSNGNWVVIEAIGEVRETPLALWIIRGRSGNFELYRPTPAASLPTPSIFHDSLTRALQRYMGRPYDFHYAPQDEAIYCSELVFKAYRDAFGLELGTWDLLGTLNWKPHEAFIRTLENGALPLERPIITPVGLTRSTLLSHVFPKQPR